MDLVKILSDKYMKAELPEMNVGDTVRVLVRVKDAVSPTVSAARRYFRYILRLSSP